MTVSEDQCNGTAQCIMPCQQGTTANRYGRKAEWKTPEVTTEDKFEQHGVPTDYLENLAKIEEQVLKPSGKVAPIPSTSHVREQALQLMFYLSHIASTSPPEPEQMMVPQTVVDDATVLFDAFNLRHPDGLPLAHLPAACIAIVRLLAKLENPHNAMALRCCWENRYVVSFAKSLERDGVSMPPLTEELIGQVELQLLKALGFRINVPSVQTWLDLFIRRFNVLTNSGFGQFLTVVGSLIYQPRILLLRAVLSEDLPPSQVAAGLLCLGFVAMTLLPVQALQPKGVSDEDWKEAFLACRLTQNVLPTCQLQADHAESVFKDLLVALHFEAEELKNAAYRVSMALQHSFAQAQVGHAQPACAPAPVRPAVAAV